jgi:hypothetical protein
MICVIIMQCTERLLCVQTRRENGTEIGTTAIVYDTYDIDDSTVDNFTVCDGFIVYIILYT